MSYCCQHISWWVLDRISKVLFLGVATGWEQYGVGELHSMLQTRNHALPCQTFREIISIKKFPGASEIILKYFDWERGGGEGGVNCMVTILVLGCFIPFLMIRSWVYLIRHPGVLSMPNRFPGKFDVGLQKVDCWEVGLYENIWRW